MGGGARRERMRELSQTPLTEKAKMRLHFLPFYGYAVSMFVT